MTINLVQCPICGQWVTSAVINVHIDNNCPPSDVDNAPSTSSPVQQEIKSSFESVDIQKAQKSINHTTNAPRMAPLFAPKPLPKQTTDRLTAPLFNASQKRTVESQPATISPKRKKMDAVAESMPLAAKGKFCFWGWNDY